MRYLLIICIISMWGEATSAQTAPSQPTATLRPDGRLDVRCPNGRTGTIIQRGTSLTFEIREPNGETWGMSEEPSVGPGDPKNLIGNGRTVADQLCSA